MEKENIPYWIFITLATAVIAWLFSLFIDSLFFEIIFTHLYSSKIKLFSFILIFFAGIGVMQKGFVITLKPSVLKIILTLLVTPVVYLLLSYFLVADIFWAIIMPFISLEVFVGVMDNVELLILELCLLFAVYVYVGIFIENKKNKLVILIMSLFLIGFLIGLSMNHPYKDVRERNFFKPSAHTLF